MAKLKQPMQPIHIASDGVVRFQKNEIISWLFDIGKIDLTLIATMTKFSKEDRMQLAQMLGYSVSGFGTLSYVTREMLAAADQEAGRLLREKANG